MKYLESLPTSEYQQRRQRLCRELPAGSVAVLFAAPTTVRNGDVEHAYRQDSSFYYLTGFAEPSSALLLRSLPTDVNDDTDKRPTSLILCRAKDPLQEIWHGRRLGVNAAADALNLDAADDIANLETCLDEWLDGAQYVYFSHRREDVKANIDAAIMRLYGRQRNGVQTPEFHANLDTRVDEMRLIKSAAEIAVMRHACAISARAHMGLMARCQPQMKEYQLAAHFAHACAMEGSPRLAYESIVANGKNACILHYVDNNQSLGNGDLVLVDAGCEVDYYASDITRTFPVNGRFSEPQKAIYNLVLKALEATLAVIKAGVPINTMQEAARVVITQGLVDLGILQGDPEQIIKDEGYRTFYMHNVGHWLGMDVHDVGRYKQADDWRLLQEGMVTTVEPGIYIAPNSPDVDNQWWGIGVRIEDDVLVTKDGHENLTRQVPVTITEIEALISQANHG